MNTLGIILIAVFGTIILLILMTLLFFSLWGGKRRKELVRNGTLIDTAMGQVEYIYVLQYNTILSKHKQVCSMHF